MRISRILLFAATFLGLMVPGSLARADSMEWQFDDPIYYMVSDPDSIIVEGGVAKLGAVSQRDDDAEGFGEDMFGVKWDEIHKWVELDGTTNTWELPDYASSDGWIDMTGNVLLLHLNDYPAHNDITVAENSGHGNSPGKLLTGDGFTDKSVTGKLWNAIHFDGVSGAKNDIIIGPPSNEILENELNAITIVAWMKMTSAKRAYIVSLKRNKDSDSSSTLISLAVNDDNGGSKPGNLGFLTRNDADSKHSYLEHAGNYNDGNWHHIAAVVDGPNRALYIDGSFVATDSEGMQSVSDNNDLFAIGGFRDGYGSLEFDGDLDEIAIWTRALSKQEIERIYNRQAPALAGYFDAPVMDAGALTAWNSISWIPRRPFYKQLPDFKGKEEGYPEGNVDMTGNVLLMHMNEKSGPIIDTSSEEGNNAVATGGVKYGVDGVFKAALGFGGDGDVVEASGHTYSFDKEITLAAWFRYEGAGKGSPRILEISNKGDAYSHCLAPDGDGTLRAWVQCTTGRVASVDDTNKYNDGKWHHMVYTYSDPDGILYVDGKKTTEAAGVCADLDDGKYLAIGAISDVSGKYSHSQHEFDGSIDELAVYDRVLSPDEVLDQYKRGALRLMFQVRSCNDSVCDGENFMGNDGTGASFYSELENDSLTPPALALVDIAEGSYFQYRAIMEADTSLHSPELKSVTVGPAHYSADDPTVVNITPEPNFTVLNGFAEILGPGNQGAVGYQLSADGSNWYYHDGS